MINIKQFISEKFNIIKSRKTNNGFLFETNSGKIIKCFKLKSNHQKQLIMNGFNYLKKINNSSIVKIYQFNFLKDKNELYCYYIMEKLSSLNYGYTQGSDFSYLLEKYSILEPRIKIPNYLDLKVIILITNLRKVKYKYTDFHQGNFMQDSVNTYKVIDIESFFIDFCY